MTMLQLGFTPVDQPPDLPEYMMALAICAYNAYGSPLIAGKRVISGRTVNGWKVHASIEYGKDFEERTFISAAKGHERVDVTRYCTAPVMGQSDSSLLPLLFSDRELIARAMQGICGLALTGSRSVPPAMQTELKIIKVDGRMSTIQYKKSDDEQYVVYTPISEMHENNKRQGRKFEICIFDQLTHAKSGLIKGETRITLTQI